MVAGPVNSPRSCDFGLEGSGDAWCSQKFKRRLRRGTASTRKSKLRLLEGGERAGGEDVMDWLTDDMMRQWRGVSKDEEEITVRRSEGGKLHIEKVSWALELLVAQTLMRTRQKTGKRRRWLGWSVKMMQEKANRQEYKKHQPGLNK